MSISPMYVCKQSETARLSLINKNQAYIAKQQIYKHVPGKQIIRNKLNNNQYNASYSNFNSYFVILCLSV